jgi:hypothetical protein
MGWRIKRLTQELQKHDRCLFAQETSNGMVQVWRKADRWGAADLLREETGFSQPLQFITALTDNWKLDGIPVDHGIDPLMFRIRQMDSWQQGTQLEAMRKRRDSEDEDRKRQRNNENRAIAADLRKDFAKATNDINTSILEKADARREHGTC